MEAATPLVDLSSILLGGVFAAPVVMHAFPVLVVAFAFGLSVI